MRVTSSVSFRAKRILAVLLCIFMAVLFWLPVAASAQEPAKTVVRVGWHEPPYYIKDAQGRLSGYSYDFQQKVAAYTGWDYEYVEGSWSELLEKLANGEIDMMANVSYSEERARNMLYASLPMGTESYYLFVSPDNTEITSENDASLNGKRIGVAKSSIQADLFREWAVNHNVRADLVELPSTEEESLKLLGTELDGFITMDINIDPGTAIPVWKIGSSDFYFALSKNRADLLPELNAAMSGIQDENLYYMEELNDKYLKSTETRLYLSQEEKNWLSKHGTIRVGYQDNYMAFCAKDEDTGKLTGALKDYLDYASTALENANLKFKAKAYATAAEAIEALQNGEVDCVFPANMTPYDAEELNIVMTPALMTTEMDAVIRDSEQKNFFRKKHITVAVNEGNTNYEIFLKEHFPGWSIKYFPDTPTGLEAVAAGDADCVIISNYRFSNIAKQCEKLYLTTIYTDVDMDYYLAVRKGDTQLYSILSKITDVVPDSMVHTALTFYSTEDAKSGFGEFVRDHLGLLMAAVAAILIVIIVLLSISIRAQKKVIAEHELVDKLNKQVFLDALTQIQNKGGYNKCMEELQIRMVEGDKMEFAIGIFDCNNLKKVNDKNGHDKGDIYLKKASEMICRVFKNSPVFRIGGDEFSVVMQGEDYKNREKLEKKFHAMQKEASAAAAHPWEEVHVAVGIAAFDPEVDRFVNDTVRRADKIMYENKRIEKEKQARGG